MGKDVRYEVSADQDHLELFRFNALDIGDDELRSCSKTGASECVVFVYRFDRYKGDFR
jgi:hypothetical protein